MSIKQEFQAMLDLMSEEDLMYALELIKENFSLRRRGTSWDNIEEADPDDEDFALMEKIRNRTDGYGEYITQEELLRMLGIQKSD